MNFPSAENRLEKKRKIIKFKFLGPENPYFEKSEKVIFFAGQNRFSSWLLRCSLLPCPGESKEADFPKSQPWRLTVSTRLTPDPKALSDLVWKAVPSRTRLRRENARNCVRRKKREKKNPREPFQGNKPDKTPKTWPQIRLSSDSWKLIRLPFIFVPLKNTP